MGVKLTARYPSGVTLIESLLAAVVLAMATGALIMPFAAGAQNTAHDARQTVAVNLAQDIMEEILSKPFRDPDDTEVAETGRSSWDDVDDYDGYGERAGTVQSFDGTVASDAAATGLSRTVSVKGVYVSGQDTREPPTFLRVTVEVQYKGVAITSLSRLVYAND